jgi:hypothetical protein
MDENTIPDAGMWEAVWLVHPAANGSRVAVDLSGERFEIEVIFEDVGHLQHGPLIKMDGARQNTHATREVIKFLVQNASRFCTQLFALWALSALKTCRRDLPRWRMTSSTACFCDMLLLRSSTCSAISIRSISRSLPVPYLPSVASIA